MSIRKGIQTTRRSSSDGTSSGPMIHGLRIGQMIPFKGQALLESGSALLNIVGLEPKYETITYFICILSSIFLVVAAMLSFIAIFAVKTPKWITLVRVLIENRVCTLVGPNMGWCRFRIELGGISQ